MRRRDCWLHFYTTSTDDTHGIDYYIMWGEISQILKLLYFSSFSLRFGVYANYSAFYVASKRAKIERLEHLSTEQTHKLSAPEANKRRECKAKGIKLSLSFDSCTIFQIWDLFFTFVYTKKSRIPKNTHTVLDVEIPCTIESKKTKEGEIEMEKKDLWTAAAVKRQKPRKCMFDFVKEGKKN